MKQAEFGVARRATWIFEPREETFPMRKPPMTVSK
jgi:hypothetical protein